MNRGSARTNCSLLSARRYSVDFEQCSRAARSSSVRCANPSSRIRATSASNSARRLAVIFTGVAIRQTVLQYRFQYYFSKLSQSARRPPCPSNACCPTQEAHDLIDLTRDVADKVLAPIVDEHEKTETFPDGVFPALGRAGLLSLPYPEEFGGGAQPYEVYLQVLEEIAARWAAVAVATSVHSLSCFALATHGTDEQSRSGCPTCSAARPSAPTACPNRRPAPTPRRSRAGPPRWTAASASTAARRGSPTVAVPTSTPCSPAPATTGLAASRASCPEDTEGLGFGKPEEKMGLRAVPTTAAHYDDAFVPAERLIGKTGQGLPIAFSALDSGRLGIAAVAVGLAQGALDDAVAYAKERKASASASSTIRGSVSSWPTWPPRSTRPAPRTSMPPAGATAGLPYSRNASVAKLVATDAAARKSSTPQNMSRYEKASQKAKKGSVEQKIGWRAFRKKAQSVFKPYNNKRRQKTETKRSSVATSFATDALRE